MIFLQYRFQVSPPAVLSKTDPDSASSLAVSVAQHALAIRLDRTTGRHRCVAENYRARFCSFLGTASDLFGRSHRGA